MVSGEKRASDQEISRVAKKPRKQTPGTEQKDGEVNCGGESKVFFRPSKVAKWVERRCKMQRKGSKAWGGGYFPNT